MGSKDGNGKSKQGIDDGSAIEAELLVVKLMTDLSHQLEMATARREECQAAYLEVRDESQDLAAMKEWIEKIIEVAMGRDWSDNALRLIYDITKAMRS